VGDSVREEHFVGGRVWATLTNAAERSSGRSYIAVAYFGKGAARLLPLTRGSYLVVDASDKAVKSGQTCPASLRALLKKGVRIYSSERLHAKVFVFGKSAFVGSANVSTNSQNGLFEAIVRTSNRRTVALARQFVREHCIRSIGPEEIKRLSKIYRPPNVRLTKTKPQVSMANLKIIRLSDYELPASREGRYVRSETLAKKKIISATHQLYDFYWKEKHKFLEGERILPIHKDADGVSYVSPPGSVISITHFKDGLKYPTMIFLEMPKRRRLSLNELIRRVGRGCRAKLEKGRVIYDSALVGQIFDLFQPPSTTN
jgi:PLD-like domain